MSGDDRRRFPRLLVPVFYRSARLLAPRKQARDISLGGIRVLTDTEFQPDQRLEIELFLPSGSSFSVNVSVSWVAALPLGSEARFEAGLQFLALDAEKADLLQQCVGHSSSRAPPR
jgi:hypothetical protein